MANSRTLLALLCLLLSVGLGVPAFAQGITAQPSPTPSVRSDHVTVYVFDASEPQHIPGAKVRVLSRGGRLLVEVTTNSAGEASLPHLDAKLEPSLILVEHEAFYIGGTRWNAEADEVCVHLAIWRTCCLTRIRAD